MLKRVELTSDNLARAKLLTHRCPAYDVWLCINQFILTDTHIDEIHTKDRDAILLGHATFVRIFCLLSIAHNQVGTLCR